jgi:hypothetical protein
MTLTQSHPEIFDFPRRMEREHALSGGERRDKGVREPRIFFRENNSTETLFAKAAAGFEPFSDEHFIPFDDELDVGGACGDSCEVYADMSDDDDSENFPLLPNQHYNNTNTVMPLETEIAALTAALKENTAALNATLVAAGKTTAAPAPAAATQEIEIPEKIEKKGPGRPKATPAAAPAADDTPSVPSNDNDSGGPTAAEHVDVDETIAEIGEIVKKKIQAAAALGEDAEVKDAWTKVREGFGVARIGDLRSDPAKLLAALDAAKKL